MIYIKVNSDNTVILGGTVANKTMLDDGYFLYEGDMPEGDVFYWDQENQLIIGDITPSKENKIKEIQEKFRDSLNSYMYSQTLQTDVNVGDEHLRNIEKLIEYMYDNNIYEIPFRVYDNSFKIVTINDLQNLKKELIQYGLYMYNKKWQLEEMVKNAKSKNELEAISW